mmetsp:Transcript_13464/g.13026  ORF Transcript_13464/g.13026 Transcript_13464/m.13026 type:complete len:890 (-) Transcript_13464:90-2759(-)
MVLPVIPLVICICISYSMISLGIKLFRETYGYDPWCHESSLCCILGLLVGGAIKFFTGSTIQFDNEIFFYVVLPPIIFSAGMSLKKKMFFKYISLITLFGVVGTIINFILITALTYYATRYFNFQDTKHKPVTLSWEHSMLLGAVLCGTDEVSALSLMPMHSYPRLGALIFGEGVLNDAISIVLFHVLMSNHSKAEHKSTTTLEELAFKLVLKVTNEVFLSFLIGVFCGLANARLLKSVIYLRHHPVHQTVLLLLFAYLAYTIAESMDVSGILTLFVTAVVQGHYSWHSLSKPAQVAIKINAVGMSDIAEGFAFSYVGLSMWEYVDSGFHIYFSCSILFIVVFSRLITIMSLCLICSSVNKRFYIPFSEQIGFTAGGIVRGCLCWAQILQIGEHRVLVTTTLFIVLTTSLAGGFLLPILIPRLGLTAIEGSSPNKEILDNHDDIPSNRQNKPRHIYKNKQSTTDKNTLINKKKSMHHINWNANADEDLVSRYSPKNGDLELSPNFDSELLSLKNTDSDLIHKMKTGGKNNLSHNGQKFMERMSTPGRFSDWDSVDLKPKKMKPPLSLKKSFRFGQNKAKNDIKGYEYIECIDGDVSDLSDEEDTGDEDDTDPLVLDTGFGGLQNRELKELDYELDQFDSRKEVEALKSQKIVDFIVKDLKGPLSGQSDMRNSPNTLSIIISPYTNKNAQPKKQPKNVKISPKNDQNYQKNSPKNSEKYSPIRSSLKMSKNSNVGIGKVKTEKDISPKSMKNNSNLLSVSTTNIDDNKNEKNENKLNILPINTLISNNQGDIENGSNGLKIDTSNQGWGWGSDLHKYRKFNFQDSNSYKNNENETFIKKEKIYKSSNYFINWVKFDEEFLKPLFGGAFRDYDEKEAIQEGYVANYNSTDN